MGVKILKTFDLSDVEGFGPALCARVRNAFAREEWRKTPYRLTECRGVGFLRADRVAKRLGIEGKDKERINAGAEHLLTEAELGGHTCLPTTEFAPDLLKLLDIHLMDFEFDDRFYEGDGLIGLRRTFEAEAAVAAQTRILTSLTVAPGRPLDLMDLKRDQVDALAVINNANMFVLLGGPGTGKCLGRGTLVLKFNGESVPVENIRAGDLLMGPDSKPRSVLSIARGKDELIEIKPIKGDNHIVNRPHVLSLRLSSQRYGDRINNVTLDEFLSWSKRRQAKAKLWRTGIEFHPIEIPPELPPYLLGLWLGDGDKSSRSLAIHSNDLEVRDYLAAYAEKYDLRLVNWRPNRCGMWVVVGKRDKKKTLVMEHLSQIDPTCVPYAYKCNSRQVRLEVLAGLLDSDGHLMRTGGFDFISKYPSLAEDVTYIARSLGLAAYCKLCVKTCSNNGKSDQYWRVGISGDCTIIPTKIERRRAKSRQQVKNVLRTGFKWRSLGIGEYFGFTLDGDGLFLLGDFTVTHNTHLIRRLAQCTSGKVALCAPTGKAAKRIEELTGMEAKTIHRLLQPADKLKNKTSFSRGFNFVRNRLKPLDADLVIMDEASMCDVKLLADLMDALPVGCRLMLVGDPFQLPSVGPGAVLRDLVAGHGVVPYVELMELKRQNPDLLIAKNCQEIRWRKRILVDNRKASDFVMLPIEKPEAIRDAVVEMVAERLPAKYGLDPSEIMVIAPLRGKMESKRAHQQPVNLLAVNKLNEALRARLNPEAKNFAGIWVGDRVIQRSNDRDLDVVNGDTGTVVEADEHMLTVAFDTPEREVTASRADFDLELAYALTVHKAQGSQAPAVVFVIDPAGNAQWVADAQLTYTAISRAVEICVAIGDKKTLDTQVARHKAIGRWTRLGGMLRQSA